MSIDQTGACHRFSISWVKACPFVLYVLNLNTDNTEFAAVGTRRKTRNTFEKSPKERGIDVRGWTLAGALDGAQCALLLKEANVALREFVLNDGRVRFQAPAHVVKALKF